jgi:hypothetical protein
LRPASSYGDEEREKRTSRSSKGRGSEIEPPTRIHTVICPVGCISFVPRNVEDGAFDRDENGFGGVGSWIMPRVISSCLQEGGEGLISNTPSHLASSSYVIGSSFGGASSTGCLGAKLLGSVLCSIGLVGSVILAIRGGFFGLKDAKFRQILCSVGFSWGVSSLPFQIASGIVWEGNGLVAWSVGDERWG